MQCDDPSENMFGLLKEVLLSYPIENTVDMEIEKLDDEIKHYAIVSLTFHISEFEDMDTTYDLTISSECNHLMCLDDVARINENGDVELTEQFLDLVAQKLDEWEDMYHRGLLNIEFDIGSRDIIVYKNYIFLTLSRYVIMGLSKERFFTDAYEEKHPTFLISRSGEDRIVFGNREYPFYAYVTPGNTKLLDLYVEAVIHTEM